MVELLEKVLAFSLKLDLGGLFRKYLSILCKTIFGVFPPVLAGEWLFFVFLIKKEVLVVEENSGLHKRIIFMNLFHESFPTLVFEESLSI